MRYSTRIGYIALGLVVILTMAATRYRPQPQPDTPIKFTSERVITTDPGLYTPVVSQAPSFQACWDGCKVRTQDQQNHGNGCVLFDAEPGEDANKVPTCKCIWLCMPQLKYYQ